MVGWSPRMGTVLVGALALMAAHPALAGADSIVFERAGNIWQAAGDGSGQRQITTSGGYARPTQSSDGTILAVKDKVLQRIDRAGRVLNTAGYSDAKDGGILTPHVSPDGRRVVYNYFSTGPNITGPGVAVSFASRPTGRDEIDNSMRGYLNPTWLDNGRAVVFPQSATVDTQVWTIPGNVQDWFTDTSIDLTGGEVNAAGTRFASAGDGGSKIRLYAMNGPAPAAPTGKCDLTGPVGSFFRPTWSPDGVSLAWQEDNGVWIGRVPSLDACASVTARLAIPGARAPDWGPVSVFTPPPVAPVVTAKVPKKIRRRALLRGFTVRVKCSEACSITADLLNKRKRIGRKRKTLAAAGTAKLKLRPTAKARRKLKRKWPKRVTVRIRAKGASGKSAKTITRKIRIRR